MPDFDDVHATPHLRPQLDYQINIIERYTVLLKDGETTATIYPIHSADELPPGLLAFLCDEFNMEVERGDTFPFFDTLHIETFQNYWFGSFAAVMVLGDVPSLDRSRQWEKECLGTFYIRPNYPGRCSHICTAGFLVNAGIRGKGIGRTLAECYLEWAPRLGYTYSIFNLVFDINEAAKKIWESLGFKIIGNIKAAGILKGHGAPIDALIYGRELMASFDPGASSVKFERVKYYLETGSYPESLNRQEKSRLRALAAHYKMTDGKLTLKGREVIADPAKQLEIATAYHKTGHTGVNKCTSAIAEKYHWPRIKETVASVLRNCDDCRAAKGLLKRSGPGSRRPYKMIKSESDHNGDSSIIHNNNNIIGDHEKEQRRLAITSGSSKADEDHNIDDHFNHLGEFDSDDPSSIIAAVEAAQRSRDEEAQKGIATAAHGSHSKNHQNGSNDKNSSKKHKPAQHHHQAYEFHEDDNDTEYNYNQTSGIDPDVISRALIQVNEEEERHAQRQQQHHGDNNSNDEDNSNDKINM